MIERQKRLVIDIPETHVPSILGKEQEKLSDSLVPSNSHLPKQINFLKCTACKRNNECPHFKPIYKRMWSRSKALALPKIKELNEKVYYDYIKKEWHKDEVEKQIKRIMKEMMENNREVCIYEQQMAQDMLKDFHKAYNLEGDPTLKYLIYNIISKFILDLRLRKAVNQTDIMKTQVVMTDSGPVEVEVITPTLNYTIKLSESLSKSLADMYKLVEGQKLKIEGEVSIKDVMRKIIDLDKVEDKNE